VSKSWQSTPSLVWGAFLDLETKQSMPTHWTHITINCSDINASVDFYTSLCGLSIVRDRRLEGRHNVWLGPPTEAGADPVFVLVIVQDEVKARLDHFGFQCDSRSEVDRIAEQAREQKILVQEPIDAGGVVGYFAMVRDPDGHIVEFTLGQPLKGLS
jgi:lactoylglutathione lyase